MKLIFAGSGSAFSINHDNYHSNILLVNPETRAILMIDCGSDARHSLRKLGYSYIDITDVYISHLHADHTGGLEWLGLMSKFDPDAPRPHLYANTNLIKLLWDHTLSGGMRTLGEEKATLSCFYQPHPIPHNGSFIWQNTVLQTIQTVHVMDGPQLMPSYGLFFTLHGKHIFITTDTQFIPSQFDPWYRKADIIFHDCETSLRPSHVHAHFDQLVTLDPAIKAKMWLYHYNPENLPDAVAHGFLGWVQRGQVFEFV